MELIYFISFIVVFVLLAFLYNRYKGKIIANKLSAVLGIKLSGTKGTAVWNGIKFEYDYDSGGEDYIDTFLISVPCKASGNFFVTKKGSRNPGNFLTNILSKAKKSKGILSEVKTHDITFDKDFYITADSTGFANSFFQSHERRKAIKDIFLSGCQEIVCNGKSISVRWVSLGYKIKYDYSAVPKVILNLAELTKGYTDTT